VQSFAKSFFDPERAESCKPVLATARAGNIIGGGDWGEDRLIPDLARLINTGGRAIIRSPDSIRPWQFILDALSGYLILAENLFHHGSRFAGSWNFGPSQFEVLPVKVLANKFIEKTDVKIEIRPKLKDDIEEKLILRIDAEKARRLLKWQTRTTLEKTISLTRQWYIDFYRGCEVKELCKQQIDEFQQS
jgi:CDP-glucose 4,6-dehydratase